MESNEELQEKADDFDYEQRKIDEAAAQNAGAGCASGVHTVMCGHYNPDK